MHAAVTVSDTGTMANQMVTIKKDPSSNRLKNFWVNLDDKTKRDFFGSRLEKAYRLCRE